MKRSPVAIRPLLGRANPSSSPALWASSRAVLAQWNQAGCGWSLSWFSAGSVKRGNRGRASMSCCTTASANTRSHWRRAGSAAPATPVNSSRLMLGSLAIRRVAARAALTFPQPLQARLMRMSSPHDPLWIVRSPWSLQLRSLRWLRSEPISSGMAPSRPICSGCVMVS